MNINNQLKNKIMKTQMKKIAIAIVMIIAFCGSVNAQHEIAVKNDSNVWVAGNWKNIPGFLFNQNASNFNYRDINIAGIGGDTICLKLVDTTTVHNSISVWRWEINQDGYTTTISVSDTSYHVLPIDGIYFQYIRAYYDTANIEKYTQIIIWSKFLAPVFEISDTINNTKNSSMKITLADFGLTIDASGGASDTAYYNKINWYRDGLLIHEGTGLDTTYAVDSTGNYSVQVEVLYFTKSFIIGDTTTKAFSKWEYSNSIYVDMAIFNSYEDYSFEKNTFKIYPNPTTDYLYISIDTEYTIFSITGQEILKGIGNKIDVSMFNKGVYIIKTSDGNKKFSVQ